MNETDRSIDGVAKTISEVLEKKKYSIDYYQREYKWESKHVADLVNDLATKFLDIYDPQHSRKSVGGYPGYYLGSIIISLKGSQPFIVDGQQRLTTLTLLLTFLRHIQNQQNRADSDVVKVDDLIYSEKFGERSFNLDIPERRESMDSLFRIGSYNPPEETAPESVYTLVDRYEELDELFPDDLRNEALPYFIDWLKDRVQLVQITAYTDDDAYTIFETMNDRGLKLAPADMLKGYLLANVEDGQQRNTANDVWRRKMRSLNDFGEDLGSDFLKNWLRSQYATRIRERKKSARREDWDEIGTEFHRWVRKDRERIGLRNRSNFYDFIVRDMEFYGNHYQRVVRASKGPLDTESPLRFIRYNADHQFTLQDQLLLAPLRVDDDQPTIDKKLELVARFADILLARRIWNQKTTAYSTMQYAMFIVMRDIRGLTVPELANYLCEYLAGIDETFDSNDDLVVHQQNRSQLHKLLARITDFVAVGSGRASTYAELTGGTRVRYEVEHIWADHPERHVDEFPQESDFARHRNRIGDLLLLPKSFNASFGDDTYEQKLPQYLKQNILAQSLNSMTYQKDPGFANFIKSSELNFKPYANFKAPDIIEHGQLYRDIAKRVWNPQELFVIAEPEALLDP
ncbi:DUF262 domain-containing protein [Mycobacterium avium subsp. hominissuis]